MTLDVQTLPQDFKEFEPFIDYWVKDGSAERAALRNASSEQEREVFVTAVGPRFGEALDYLDGVGLENFTPSDTALMKLTLTFAHMIIAQEVQGPAEVRLAPWRARMVITHSPANM